ncbi:transposase [Streptomyces sp. NPDC000349]|uniref:transposase n=1 Tax=Streptomyces sp. NPDC000349 TaxID=3154249 RepID=UPI003369BF9B
MEPTVREWTPPSLGSSGPAPAPGCATACAPTGQAKTSAAAWQSGTSSLLIDGAQQLLKAPIVVVWDRLNNHVSHAVCALIAECEWLTVFLLPACSPDRNSVEWMWAHVKRSLSNLAVVALDRLEALVRNRLKRLQYRPDTLDGFIAGTGLTLTSRRQ